MVDSTHGYSAAQYEGVTAEPAASTQNGGGSGQATTETSDEPPPRAVTEADVRFVVDLLRGLEQPGQQTANHVRTPPPGDRWVDLSLFAQQLDRQAPTEVGQDGVKWRQQFGRKGFTQLLTQEPFVQRVELEAIRRGPTHIDWWIRLVEDDDEDDA